ncbi:MAG: CYTH domain-containing protein [Proteobacteria bacterium]|nr:CYTH domain-containing protein [Pseudomonadota bacterium]
MSDAPQEVEFKRRLPDADAFERVCAAAGGRRHAPVEQANHFFDTPSRALAAAEIGCRLRAEGDVFTFTLKGPTQPGAGDGPATRAEVEWRVEPTLARAVLAGAEPVSRLVDGGPASDPLIAAWRDACGDEALEAHGTFHNWRTRVETALPGDAGELAVVLEFDETHFPGPRVDREVELEVPPGRNPAPYGRALDALLAQCRVELEPSGGKLSRLRAILAQR